MNSNSFTASLTNGYGKPVPPDMLALLGLDRDDPVKSARMPAPMAVNRGLSLCRRLPRPANRNLRRAG
jgi:hypothetical protein